MTLRRINITLGIIQIVICGLTVLPMTIQTIVSKGGGFGFGLLFLPILIPLSCSMLFGLIGLLDYKENYKLVKLLITVAHLVTAFSGIVSFLFMPIFPIILLVIQFSIWLLLTLTRNNIGRQLLFINALLTTGMIVFLSFCFHESDKNIVEFLIKLWK